MFNGTVELKQLVRTKEFQCSFCGAEFDTEVEARNCYDDDEAYYGPFDEFIKLYFSENQ